MYQVTSLLLFYTTVTTAVYAPASYVAPVPAAYYGPASRIAAIPAYAAPGAYAAPVKYASPVAYAPKVAAYDIEYDPNPSYNFAYDIQDHVTGDSKSQHESRTGDVVHGSYSLIEPDGSKRTVEYTADPQNGFNAVVHKEPNSYPTAKALAASAPILKYAPPVVAYAPAPTPFVYAH